MKSKSHILGGRCDIKMERTGQQIFTKYCLARCSRYMFDVRLFALFARFEIYTENMGSEQRLSPGEGRDREVRK